MDYLYRPQQNGMKKIQPVKRLAYHNRINPRSPGKIKLAWQMPQFEIPWRSITIIGASLAFVGCLWFGGNMVRNWMSARRSASEAQSLAQSQANEAWLRENLKSQISNARDAIRIGQERQKEGKIDEAIAAYNIALEYEPNWRDAYLCLGQAYLIERDYSGAETALSHALSIDPIYPTTHNLLAILYEKTDRAQAAQSENEKADKLANDMGLEIGG